MFAGYRAALLFMRYCPASLLFEAPIIQTAQGDIRACLAGAQPGFASFRKKEEAKLSSVAQSTRVQTENKKEARFELFPQFDSRQTFLPKTKTKFASIPKEHNRLRKFTDKGTKSVVIRTIRLFFPTAGAFFQQNRPAGLSIPQGMCIFAYLTTIPLNMTTDMPDKKEQPADESIRLSLETTADGSHTFYLPALDEHYHSVNGALRESRHVFIEAGWEQRLSAGNVPAGIRLLEIGFGTGLNAFLTMLQADSARQCATFYSIERYPLDDEAVQTLNYADLAAPGRREAFRALHRAPWNRPVRITPFFILHKLSADCNTCPLPGPFDLIYFDAFAPDKQPEMWNQPLFDTLFRHTAEGGILTTYCAKGAVRRMLQAAGYRVERLPGPPGKREMLRAQKDTARLYSSE